MLDAVLYADVTPFWPLLWNPFLGLLPSLAVYALTVLAALAAVPLLHRVSRAG